MTQNFKTSIIPKDSIGKPSRTTRYQSFWDEINDLLIIMRKNEAILIEEHPYKTDLSIRVGIKQRYPNGEVLVRQRRKKLFIIRK